MDEFLTNNIAKLKTKNFSALTIVLGNESCDLDSAVCSIVYAAYLHWQHNKIKCNVCTKKLVKNREQVKDEIFIPVLNVDRKYYPIKTEVKFCLDEHGIVIQKLIFRDDFNFKELISTCKANVVLVDHHILAKRDAYVKPYVTEIIDHRPVDTTNFEGYREDVRTTMELVGSCATLVTQRIKDLSTLVAKETDFFQEYHVCPELLHCTIILDTVNLSPEVKKATEHDINMVLFLEHIFHPVDTEAERKCKLDRLSEARGDVSKLSLAQLVMKDVKAVGYVLIPSLPILVKDFLARPGALDGVNDALAYHDCCVALLLGYTITEGQMRRDAAVYSGQLVKAGQLAKYLEQNASPPLSLVRKEALRTAPDCFYFEQLNVATSRKQYALSVSEYIQSCAEYVLL